MPTFSRRTLLTGGAAGLAGWLAPSTAEACPRVTPEYFEVVHRDIALTGLEPAHHGLTMVQLSDLHFGRALPELRIRNAIRAVNALKPDLVVLTGDFVTTRADPHELPGIFLSELNAPAIAVPGNHDHWSKLGEVEAGLERHGISLLRNQHTTVRLRGVDLPLIGVDDSTTHHDDVETAFRGAPAHAQLVLTHTPNCAAKLPRDRGLLCLSGHTHGGQLDVPGLTGGLFRTFGQPWYRGAYEVRGNHLYVNRGLGFGEGAVFPRMHSDPEVTVFTLSSAEVLAAS